MNHLNLRKTLSFFCFFILLAFTIKIYGQENKLTLSVAVDKAYENNPEIQQWKAKLKAKSIDWRNGLGIQNPELTYFKEGMNRDSVPGFAEQRIAIRQSIDFPLTSVYKVKTARKEFEAMQLQFEAFKRQIKSEVKRQYIELLYAIYHQRLMQEQLELAQNLNEAVKTRAETGAGTGMDQLKAEIQLAQAQNQIDYAERILHQARYELFNTMGMDEDDQKYSIRFADTLRTQNDAIDQEAALEFVTEHPAYTACIQNQKAANYAVKAAKSQFLPDLSLSFYQQDYGFGYDFTGFEVGISIPLWFPLNQNTQIQQSKARLDELKWKRHEIMLEMKMQIEHAWHNYEASKNSMERFKSIIRSKSDKLRDLTLEAYRLGEIDLLNLINAQQLYLDTRKNYLVTLRDYYTQLIELEKFMNTDIVY